MTKEIDALGLLCPLPVLRARKRLCGHGARPRTCGCWPTIPPRRWTCPISAPGAGHVTPERGRNRARGPRSPTSIREVSRRGPRPGRKRRPGPPRPRGGSKCGASGRGPTSPAGCGGWGVHLRLRTVPASRRRPVRAPSGRLFHGALCFVPRGAFTGSSAALLVRLRGRFGAVPRPARLRLGLRPSGLGLSALSAVVLLSARVYCVKKLSRCLTFVASARGLRVLPPPRA